MASIGIETRQGRTEKGKNFAGKVLKEVGRFAYRTPLMFGSTTLFLGAAEFTRDVRVMDGFLPIDSTRPILTPSDLIVAGALTAIGLGATKLIDHIGEKGLQEHQGEVARIHRTQPKNEWDAFKMDMYLNHGEAFHKYAALATTAAYTGVFTAGTLGLLGLAWFLG